MTVKQMCATVASEFELDPRTPRRWHGQLVKDESGAWSPVGAGRGRDLLPVYTAVLEHTEGRHTLTKDEARWSLKVLRALPVLPGYDPLDALTVYRLALAYRARHERKEPTEDLDVFIGLQPWRGPWAETHFLHWVQTARASWFEDVPAGAECSSGENFRYTHTDANGVKTERVHRARVEGTWLWAQMVNRRSVMEDGPESFMYNAEGAEKQAAVEGADGSAQLSKEGP
jgi:hypothetical protein